MSDDWKLNEWLNGPLVPRDTARWSPWLHPYYARYYGAQVPPPTTPRSVLFVIGSPGISGGSNVIFNHALFMAGVGWDVTIAYILEQEGTPPAWHPALEDLRVVPWALVRDEFFDLAIATWWPTVSYLPAAIARHYAYFVQSIESRFAALEADIRPSMEAELTYSIDMPVITIASWLQVYLSYEHRRSSFLCTNGVDKGTFALDGPVIEERPSGHLRALVEGPPNIPMKGVDEALEACRRAGIEEVWLLSSAPLDEYPGADRVMSQVPITEVGAVYRSCDVLVKTSHVEGLFGPPLEMMHCGGTVVSYAVTGADEIIRDGVNGRLTAMGDVDGVAAALAEMKADPGLVRQLKAGATRTAAAWPDWEAASSRFETLADMIVRQPAVDPVRIALPIAGIPHVGQAMGTPQGLSPEERPPRR